jgi:hypothetical protein
MIELVNFSQNRKHDFVDVREPSGDGALMQQKHTWTNFDQSGMKYTATRWKGSTTKVLKPYIYTYGGTL